MKTLNLLISSPFLKWGKYAAYLIGTPFVVIVLLSIIATYHTKKSPSEFPTPKQQMMISKSKALICKIDIALCEAIDSKDIEFEVINLPQYLDLIRSLFWAHYAVAEKTDSGYRISLTNHIFDDISATTVFIYHELQHVNISNFALYEEGADERFQCIDHNIVKDRTSEFAKKLDHLLSNKVGTELTMTYLPTIYAQLSGNTAKICD